MTIEELLADYQRLDIYERGKKFERLMKNFSLNYPVYQEIISKVYLWNEFSNEPDIWLVKLSKENFGRRNANATPNQQLLTRRKSIRSSQIARGLSTAKIFQRGFELPLPTT